MTPIQKRIAQYQYEDSLQRLNTTVAGNLLLAFFLMMPDFNHLLQRPHALICLATAGIFYTFKRMYDWRTNLTNLLLILFYLGLYAFEYFQFGIPGYPLLDYWVHHEISKGIMLDLLVWSLPIIYIGLRLFLVIPLLLMVNVKGR